MAAAEAAPTVLIMAAGEGTRMRSALPKVLHEVCGRPMIAWPVLAAREAGAGQVVVITSPDRDLTPGLPEGTETVVQPEANGTGGAVRAAIDFVRDANTVIVLNGDHPVVSADAIRELVEVHEGSGASATVISVERDDAHQLGRIVRDADGEFDRIVETKHPEGVPAEILAIREINTNQFAFAADALTDAIDKLGADNAAGEYYLGDVLPLIREAGGRVIAHTTDDVSVNIGVNNCADLARAERDRARADPRAPHARRRHDRRSGHHVIEADVEIAADVTIEPGTSLRGATTIGPDSVVGPHTTATDARIGSNSQVLRSHLVDCEVGDECAIGPFSYLSRRPPSTPAPRPAPSSRSRTRDRRGAKVPHLSYATPKSAPGPTSGPA